MTTSLPTEPPKFMFCVCLITDLPTVGIVLVLHAKCCFMTDSNIILLHGNCSHAWLEDVWAVLGHYSSTMWPVAPTRATDTMVYGHVP
jgi:hypothetical protein